MITTGLASSWHSENGQIENEMGRSRDPFQHNAFLGRRGRNAALQANPKTPDCRQQHGQTDIDMQIGVEQVSSGRLGEENAK